MDTVVYALSEHVVLKLGRRIDATSAPNLESECTVLLENTSLRLIIIDMEDTEYISSAGLKVILFMAQTLRPRQGEVCFVALKSQVQDIFTMSGFMSLFQAFPSVAEAVEQRVV